MKAKETAPVACIYEYTLTDGSTVYEVKLQAVGWAGHSDPSPLSFHCVNFAHATRLVEEIEACVDVTDG